MRKFLAQSLVGLVFALPFGLFGEDDKSMPVYELEDFVVRAWHFEQDILDIPSDAVLINRDTIENSAVTSVPDLLSSEANVVFRSFNGKGNESEAALRGFGEGSGLRVLVLVDGIKVNRSDMGNIEWQLLPLRDIESIELLKGGHNVLYGNHALSGVIKITTRKGEESRSNLSAFAGSDGYENVDASHSGSHGDFFYRVHANNQRDEGYRENSLSWTKGVKLNFGYFIGETDEMSTSISLSEGYLEFPGPLTLEAFREDPTQSQSGDQDSLSDNFRQTVSWFGEHSWGEFEVHGGYYKRELKWVLDGIFGENEQDGFSFTPKVKYGDQDNFVTVGIDLLHDTILFTDFTTEEREYIGAEADLARRTAGAYIFAKRSVTDHVSLSGGVRYETVETDYEYLKYDETQLEPYDPLFGDPFNPNSNFKNPADIVPEESYSDILRKDGWAAEMSVNYRLNERASLWAGYDRVYRYPVLDEVAAYQGFLLTEPLNQDLEPEEGDNFEIGFKYRGTEWEFFATCFYMHLDNEIAYDEAIKLNTNIGPTNRLGADISLRYEKEKYGASTQWSFVDATFDGGEFNGNRVPLVPAINGVSQFWLNPFSDWRAALIITFIGDRYRGDDDGNEFSKYPSYALFDAQLSHDFNEKIKVFARVNNLFDRQHISTGFAGGLYPGAGRSLNFGMSAEF